MAKAKKKLFMKRHMKCVLQLNCNGTRLRLLFSYFEQLWHGFLEFKFFEV